MSIYLLPESLLVGNQASKPRWAPLFPEFDVVWMQEELLNGNPFFPIDRPADRYSFDPAHRDKLRESIEFWKGQTHTDRLYRQLPATALAVHKDIKAADIGAYFQGGDGHYSPDHRWLFTHGLQYVIDKCDRELAEIDWGQPDSIQRKDFYEAARISAGAVIEFAARYVTLMEEMLQNEKDSLRCEELSEMIRICKKVPRYPAESMRLIFLW